MRAYKFLAAGAVGRFSSTTWPVPAGDEPGPWVAADAPLAPCRHGIHACRADDVANWLDDELWEIELDGQLIEHEDVLVAERGRLLGRIDAWNPRSAGELVAAVRERVAQLAPAVAYTADLEPLAHGQRPDTGGPFAPLVPAATHGAVAANVAYVGAVAVGLAAGDGYDEAFAAERAWQSRWLAERLSL